jgi:mannose-1-phosphate guanylyltransferase
MITVTKEISLSGKALAAEFWEQNCEEQAEFFNQNGFKDNYWNHGMALTQIDNFVDLLDENGREFIEKIYASLQGWHYYND